MCDRVGRRGWVPGKGSTATTTRRRVEMSGLCRSGGPKEAALVSITGVGPVALCPSAPPAWAGLVPRAGTSHHRAVDCLLCQLRRPEALSTGAKIPGSWAVVCVQSKQEETTVGQAGPLYLFGEGIRPSGFVGLSAARVGGGSRPSQGHTVIQGNACVQGASLRGY